MDEKLKEKINLKINEAMNASHEISDIVKSLSSLTSNSNSFAYGITLGRLYNSFYYQCRRILKREPTKEEFSEFIKILKDKEYDFLEKLDFEK